jgi:glycosyltransferase involved in cell wall biosynthesis
MSGFSVLISVYANDHSVFFDRAFLSIWDHQTLKPNQIVLVKDGAIPHELHFVVERWKQKLGRVLKVIELSRNQGLGAALNAGLNACEYEIVARMDSDDLALPQRFEKQLEYLTSNRCVDILGTAVKEMDFSGRIVGKRMVPVDHDSIIANLWTCPLIHPTVMFRRTKILEVGNYSADLPRRQDYELWFRCAEQGLRFHNLPEILLEYRFGIHTHKKQSSKVSWRQGVIGFKGGAKIGTPLKYRLLCFLPFLRSLLPNRFQHIAYKALGRFDPRRKNEGS